MTNSENELAKDVAEAFKKLYGREPVRVRVVECVPSESWSVPPTVHAEKPKGEKHDD